MRKTTLFFIALFIFLSVPTLRAQTFTILYNFKNTPDAATPNGDLLRDQEGNLYGTTCCGGTAGWGTVFKVDPAGNETVLYNFVLGPQYPTAGLIMDKAGNLYGTTLYYLGESGYGSVFELDASGTFVDLHPFAGPPDGENPSSALIMDKRGNLYGTTDSGGSRNAGTVFKVDTAGHETVLHSFTDSPDGSNPFSGLVMDKRGNIYGTTWNGGSLGAGTVFKLDTAGRETVLHSFAGSDGAGPMGGLVNDSAGNLYGTTSVGGPFNAGTVFKLDKHGHVTVLHSFTGSPDGASSMGDLVMDKAGNLYGTTYNGGSTGVGTVFKVDICGNETVLHNFTDVPDGAYPTGGLTMDKGGNLYGTTQNGGALGVGTVFKLTPSDCDEHQGFGCEERHDSGCHEQHGRMPKLNP